MQNKTNNNWPSYYLYYILMLVFFGVFILYYKHDVGNDSTISDWLINYSGGFVRRGLIGQLAIEFSNFFFHFDREGRLLPNSSSFPNIAQTSA